MTTSDPHPDTHETHSMTDNNPSDSLVSDELTTLYDASDGGTTEWWPFQLVWYLKEIHYTTSSCIESDGSVSRCLHRIEPHHALAIVRDSAERWLVSKGWTVFTQSATPGVTQEIYTEYNYCDDDPSFSLADAIRVEMGRE